jgi:hypothetical protein
MHQPAIVFTEFRDTLERLFRAAAGAGHEVRLLHGGLSPGERLDAQREFSERGGVLLATDAASEGLNLQRGCRTVIHYELPWSPARLEQRTGRVDRIGQARTVHEVLLVADDTAERLVLAPLARRAARARRGASSFLHLSNALSESRVATAVMDGQPLQQLEDRGDSRLVPPNEVRAAPATLRVAADEEVVRLRELRGWLTASGARARPAALIGTMVHRRHSSLAPGVICIYTITLSTRDGLPVFRQIGAALDGCQVRTGHAAAPLRRLIRNYLEAREPAVRAVFLASREQALAAEAATHAQALEALEQRERTIAAHLSSPTRELVQAGLFDRREIKEHETRRRAFETLQDACAERLRSLDESRVLSPIAELVAILVVCGDNE